MTDAIFVTGFPGAAATRFVELVLGSCSSKIWLLAENSHMSAAKKMASKASKRIHLLEGSSKKIDFGLSGKQYLELAGQVTKIAHLEMAPAPGSTDLKSRLAAREVIELALAAENLEHILALSHVDVCGNMSGNFAEHDLELSQGFAEPAQKDRFRAERIFRRFMDTLPITIVRSGWIVGSGQDTCPIVELLVAADDPSMLPNKEPSAPLNLIPLEHLAQILIKVVNLPSSKGGTTLHCISSNLPKIAELATQFKTETAKMVPQGFEQAAGARRVLRKGQWSTKDFFKRQPINSQISTVFSDRYLEQRSIGQSCWNEDILRDLTTKAIEGIVGFK